MKASDDPTEARAPGKAVEPKVPKPKLTAEERRAREHDRILKGALGGEFDILNQRIAWILNNYPEARDSDIKLQLRYWSHFEDWDGGPIHPQELFNRARLTSLSRARAYLQNTHNLFLASPEIRKRRGKLSEEERQKALEEQPAYPLISIYADESGKNADHLIVASVWFLHAPDTLALLNEIARWRSQSGFESEFHFKDLRDNQFDYYREFVDLVTGSAATLSFKAISVPRRGIGRADTALEDLFHFLLLRGAEHENQTGRAPLPRTIQLWKDHDDEGRDTLLLAKLKQSLAQAGKLQYDGKLTADEFVAVKSDELVLIQIADLFAGSLNRVLNAPGERRGKKDEFADYFLASVGMPSGPSTEAYIGDMAVLLQL